MITRLRLKNWRSIKEETIDFTEKITVFIGANSSGKTNIVDSLYFLRDAIGNNLPFAWNQRLYPDDYRTLGADSDAMEIEMLFQPERAKDELTYKYAERSLWGAILFSEQLTDSDGITLLESDSKVIKARQDTRTSPTEVTQSDALGVTVFGRLSTYPQIQKTFEFIKERWQMLHENFMPPMSVDVRSPYDPNVIARCADNLPNLLKTMQKDHPNTYIRLQKDLGGLLGHVDRLVVDQMNYVLKTHIMEKVHPEREAPTISQGTARILAMLTAYYALDMRYPEMPGLVVIEEPDTALNPGLLERFVGQLREYAASEHPRQFILTTHNPAFLNYFEPDEVRVVKRDDKGYTTVEPIGDHIREIWLDEYGLGEVWTTNSLGGLAE